MTTIYDILDAVPDIGDQFARELTIARMAFEAGQEQRVTQPPQQSSRPVKAVRWAEMKMLTDLKTQHASDSKELRRLLGSAMQTMTELHGSAAPDESTADIDARIPGAAFAKFVNEHAQLLFEIKNGCAAEPAPSLPAAAVAEGAQLDGESLEPSE